VRRLGYWKSLTYLMSGYRTNRKGEINMPITDSLYSRMYRPVENSSFEPIVLIIMFKLITPENHTGSKYSSIVFSGSYNDL
jgi:hypothetical protein